MKSKLTLLICLFAGLNIIAQKVNFIDNNWNEARAKAASENKLLFVDAYTDWCYWCKVMDKKTFTDAGVIQLMNEKFVSLKLEMERDYGTTVAMKYRVTGFPTFLVFAADGSLLYKVSGYQEVDAFKSFLNKILANEDLERREGVTKEIELNFPQFYKNTFGKNTERKKPEAATVQQYISAEKDLFSEMNFSVISKFTHLLSQAQTDAFVNNVSNYERLFGKSEVQDILGSIGSLKIQNAEKNNSKTEFEAAIDFFKKYTNDFTPRGETYMRIGFNKNTGNWTEFAALVDKFNADEKIDANAVNSWAWEVYEKCEDKAVIAKATTWSEAAIKQKSEYPLLDTYAALLYKGGRKKDAEKAAINAIAIGKKEGADTKETVELMKKFGSKVPAEK
jgi:thioredoxin-related protein